MEWSGVEWKEYKGVSVNITQHIAIYDRCDIRHALQSHSPFQKHPLQHGGHGRHCLASDSAQPLEAIGT